MPAPNVPTEFMQSLFDLSYWLYAVLFFALLFVWRQTAYPAWLLFYTVSVGALLFGQQYMRTIGYKAQMPDILELTLSVISSWCLAQASLRLSAKTFSLKNWYIYAGRALTFIAIGIFVFECFLVAMKTQMMGTIDSAALYKSIDAFVCMGAAGVYAFAFLKHSRGRVASILAISGLAIWAYGCAEFWSLQVVALKDGFFRSAEYYKIARMIGVTITSFASAMLAYQQVPTRESPPAPRLDQRTGEIL